MVNPFEIMPVLALATMIVLIPLVSDRPSSEDSASAAKPVQRGQKHVRIR